MSDEIIKVKATKVPGYVEPIYSFICPECGRGQGVFIFEGTPVKCSWCRAEVAVELVD